MILKIHDMRRKAGLSQKELASSCGVSQAIISQWEKEIALPRTRQLPQLAEVLGCTIDELFENPNEEVKGKCWEKL